MGCLVKWRPKPSSNEHLKRGTRIYRAIKQLKKPADSKQCSTLKKEVEILRSVRHPNMIRCFETFEDRQFIYLVQEYSESWMLRWLFYRVLISLHQTGGDICRDSAE